MARVLKWDQEAKGKNKKEIKFLKLSAGTYKVRPIGDTVEFDKYVVQGPDGSWRSAVCENVEACPVHNKYKIDPSVRYACNVIDRMDNTLKVMEFPLTVWKEFRKYFNIAKREPSGPEGADFEIKVTGAGKGKRYDVNCIGQTTISPDKMKIILERLADLNEVFKPVPADKIEEVLFGVGKKTQQNDKEVDAAADVSDLPNTIEDTADNAETDNIPF
jgi:hypothetical protein